MIWGWHLLRRPRPSASRSARVLLQAELVEATQERGQVLERDVMATQVPVKLQPC